MCRMVGYLGHPVPLSSILFDAPHALTHQSYAPRELIDGHVNVDGTGVAWWRPGDREPLRYVTDRAPWADANLSTLSPRFESGAIMAAVRSATPGLPQGPANVAPFTRGSLAGAHNGHIKGFRGELGRELISNLPTEHFESLSVLNDSRVIFLAIAARVEQGLKLRDALVEVVAEVRDACQRHRTSATLNVMIGDGTKLVAVRTSEDAPINSSYTAQSEGGTFIVSEPLNEDHHWVSVPDHTLIEATGTELTITSLKELS